MVPAGWCVEPVRMARTRDTHVRRMNWTLEKSSLVSALPVASRTPPCAAAAPKRTLRSVETGERWSLQPSPAEPRTRTHLRQPPRKDRRVSPTWCPGIVKKRRVDALAGKSLWSGWRTARCTSADCARSAESPPFHCSPEAQLCQHAPDAPCTLPAPRVAPNIYYAVAAHPASSGGQCLGPVWKMTHAASRFAFALAFAIAAERVPQGPSLPATHHCNAPRYGVRTAVVSAPFQSSRA